MRRPSFKGMPEATSAEEVRREAGGRPQRFCSSDCKVEFHARVHRLALEEIAAGRVDLKALREGRWSTVNVAYRGESPSPGIQTPPEPSPPSSGPPGGLGHPPA